MEQKKEISEFLLHTKSGKKEDRTSVLDFLSAEKQSEMKEKGMLSPTVFSPMDERLPTHITEEDPDFCEDLIESVQAKEFMIKSNEKVNPKGIDLIIETSD